MHRSIGYNQVPAFAVVIACVAMSLNVAASGLSLEDAEALAIRADPGVESVESNRLALDESAVAAGQLPDPLLKMGLISFPTDTFNFGQEAMTQVQLGLVQKFPRGQTRSLRTEQIKLQSAGLGATAQDQKLRIILAVRELFLEIVTQRHLAIINSDAIEVFSDLEDITQEYYATGRVYLQDVLQATVELAKVEDQATRIAQDEDQARARLAAWIGDAAYREMAAVWPQLKTPSSADVIKNKLRDHPRTLALQKNVSAAETGEELARQNYKPEFALDLTYGGRSGTNPDGSARADLLSLMLVMDVPLFHNNRQDRVMAARVAESSAAMFNLDDMYRRMRSEIDFHVATLQRQQIRIDLFENTLLPEAVFSSEASKEAYQSSLEDLTALLRAQITEFDLQLEHAGLLAEALKTQARLLYLEGEQL
jgi:outer membrane protein TolC